MKAFIASSSRDGILNIYKELASNVSTILARRGYKLVYGGTSSGMMQTCYMTFKYEGNKVKGFYDVTEAKDAEYLDLDAADVSPNTFTRTSRLYQSADLIVILPGGFGTLAELFSCIIEKQTKKDNKKIILFNYNKYYDNLLYQFKDMISERFIGKESMDQFDIVTNIKNFEEYVNNIEMKEVD